MKHLKYFLFACIVLTQSTSQSGMTSLVPQASGNGSNTSTSAAQKKQRIYSDDPAKAYIPPSDIMERIYSDDPAKAYIPPDNRKVYSDTPKSNTTTQIQSSKIQALNYELRNLNFGFYGSVGWGDSYSDQVKPFTNTVWIAREPGNPLVAEFTMRELKKIASDSRYKAIIDVELVFFDGNYNLHADYVDRWNQYSNLILPYQKSILSFYIMDEAYMNGARLGVSYSDMQKRIEKITKVIKSSQFASIPLSLSYTTATTHLPIPDGVDWVGVDCYGSWENCDGKSMVQHNSILKAKFKDNHRLILFVDSMLKLSSRGQPTTAIQENDLILRMNKYFDYAKSESKVIGVISFIWQDINTNEYLKGLSSLPRAKEELITLSTEYLKIPRPAKIIEEPAKSVTLTEAPKVESAVRTPSVNQDVSSASSVEPSGGAKKACIFNGGKINESDICSFGQAAASHGQYGYAFALSGGTGQVKAKCDNGQWIEIETQCSAEPANNVFVAAPVKVEPPPPPPPAPEPVVEQKGCSFAGGKISEAKSCSYAPVSAPHDGYASSPAVSGGKGAVIGRCNNGTWIDIVEYCN